jgi:glycosyltransferase involved in cell wall biosynthesis
MHDAVVLTTLPYILWMIERISRRALIYYVTDDYSHWPDADRDVMVTADAEMTKTAQMVAAVSRPLLEKYASAARREYFPHGVDWEHFASSSQLTPPELIDKLPRPRIGFFGLIYEKLDFRLLSAVADHFRTGSLVMIGPEDYCEPQFASKPNVHRIGRQSYHELPTWISGLDALILPYVDDPMIRQSGPIKLRECLATGKPTVSVDVPEVRIFQPHVRMANSVDGFIRELEWALAEQSSELARARSESVRNDGWDLRAAQLRRWIQSLADAEPPYAVGERKMA